MIRSSFGLEPVQTQVTRIAIALGCVAVTSGCDFRHYESAWDSAMPSRIPCPGKSEALCEPVCLTSPDLAKVPTPVAHWTFDGDASSAEQVHWTDTVSSLQLLRNEDAARAVKDYPRINGKGHSIYLDGNVSAYLEQDPLFAASNGFTLSVWISLERRTWLDGVYNSGTPFTWPILSTRAESSTTSGGNFYELALRRELQGGDFELVFSYGGGSPSGSHEVRYSLKDKPSWTWQAGTWHHVVVAHWKDGQFANSVLAWDEDETFVQALRTATSSSEVSTSAAASLRVGGRADLSQPGLLGYIDELALFDQPLSSQDLDRFTLSSTTRVGPSGCRWRAAENWNDSVNQAISKTEWVESASSAAQATVKINDQDWGAGSLQAILPIPLPLRNYRYLHLQASVVERSAFQLTLAKGATYCSWVAMGKGATDTHYQFDLTQPMNCVSRSCEIDLMSIESISIASEWSIPCASQPQDVCVEQRPARAQSVLRPPGDRKFTVFDMAFEPTGLVAPVWSAYDRAVGPNNWCWRPQAYEPGALGTLSAAIKAESVTAQLTGPELTATRLVADFGDAGRDLSKCTSVVFYGAKVADGIPSFVIEDVNGSWGTDDIITRPDGSFWRSNIRNLKYNSIDVSQRTNNFANFPTSIDYTKIRYLGVQKNWASATNEDATVTITGVQLSGDDNGPCQ